MQMLARGIARGVPAGVALMDCPGHGERRARARPTRNSSAMSRAAWAIPPATPRSSPTGSRSRAPRERSRRSSAGRSATRGSRWARSSGSRSSPTCTTCARRCSRSVECSTTPRSAGGARRLRNARVRDAAGRLGDREVLMLNMTRDEHFPIDGAIEVLERSPGRSAWACGPGRTSTSRRRRSRRPIEFLARTLTP